jgi:hypothetical protein
VKKVPAGYTVEKFPVGQKYPRNGNIYRPTTIYSWTTKHGERLLGVTSTRSAALEIVELHLHSK